ncbi:hypothetical protein QBC37DRAFT_422427 [Rhypophila decipiens]|uniref:Uncharacterized protein n=1 Tax=Rhypophila decipiens TaxID=261697 RepID=A0AAN6Y715_9PEZI|nr:hypothetical protein QBC37DRAFT_422427 [Rhypophila decipiens]
MFTPIKVSLLLAQLSTLQLGLALVPMQRRQEDSVQIAVFPSSQGTCAIASNSLAQTFIIRNSTRHPCFITTRPFLSMTVNNVAESFIREKLGVVAYDGPGCTGLPVFILPLTDSDLNCCDSTFIKNTCGCEVTGRCSGQEMQSFRIE